MNIFRPLPLLGIAAIAGCLSSPHDSAGADASSADQYTVSAQESARTSEEIADQIAVALEASEESKLVASDPIADDNFGFSVAIDGDTALVGAWLADGIADQTGAAYVYARSGGTWTQQGKLEASDPSGNSFFGFSVALSGDTAIVGSLGSNGAVYVFTRDAEVWTEEGKLVAGDPSGNAFGASVAIDGDTSVVGANQDDDGAMNSGAAYIFTRSGGLWTEQIKLLASDAGANSALGISVAVAGDIAIVGANQDDEQGSQAGAAYVFARAAGTWSEQGKLMPSDPAIDAFFGGAVALSGTTAIIGATGDGQIATKSGAAYIFTEADGTWTQDAKLVASDLAADDGFGGAVSISGDRAIVGTTFGDDQGGDQKGSAYLFVQSAGGWDENTKVVSTDSAALDQFGNSVGISGSTIIIGVKYDDDGGTDSGSARVFALNPLCGDGLIEGTEVCDDDNIMDGDGCSVSCVPETGYTCTTVNPAVCTDDDECTLETDNCAPTATCTNTPGSFTCACGDGFTGDGLSCSTDPIVPGEDDIESDCGCQATSPTQTGGAIVLFLLTMLLLRPRRRDGLS